MTGIILSPQTYTVTYHGNGSTNGTVPVDSNTYSGGATVTVLDNTGDLTKTHCSFAGWNTASDGMGTERLADSQFTIGSANVDLYAVWTPDPTYTVSFDSKGGSSVNSISGLYSGAKISAPTSPTKTHYTFGGWYKETECNNAWDFDTDTVTANKTLFAKWNAVPTYTVSFDSQGGSSVNPISNVYSGDKISAPTAPTKAHNVFAGWYTEAECTNAWDFSSDTVTASRTLFAKWTPEPTYTVTYNGNGNTAGSVPTDSGTYYTGDSVTVKGNTGSLTKTGYTFAGWNTAADKSGTAYAADGTFTMGSANVALYAAWNVNSTNPGGGGGASAVIAPVNQPVTGNANVTPAVGGVVGYQNNAVLTLNPNSLTGTGTTAVTIVPVQQPTIPVTVDGARPYTTLSSPFQFTVGNLPHYTFGSGGAHLTMTFNPGLLPTGCHPAIFWLNEGTGNWVSLGGTVNANTISVTLQHLTIYQVFAVPDETVPGAQQETKLIFTIGKSNYTVNDQAKTMDAIPSIKNGRTLLPIRYVAEPLGANIEWNKPEQKVTVKFNGKSIELWIGQNQAVVNGVTVDIDAQNKNVKPIIMSGRTVLPLRFIAEQLGFKVDWNNQKQIVTLTYTK